MDSKMMVALCGIIGLYGEGRSKVIISAKAFSGVIMHMQVYC